MRRTSSSSRFMTCFGNIRRKKEEDVPTEQAKKVGGYPTADDDCEEEGRKAQCIYSVDLKNPNHKKEGKKRDHHPGR